MITIIIDNYKGQKITYTMPDTAVIEMISENVLNINKNPIKTGLRISVDCAAGIETEREDLTDGNKI